MISKSTIKIAQAYYEAIDPLDGVPTYYDFYRFKRIKKFIIGNSVLDVGCGQASFLKSIKSSYQIAGTEINNRRVDYCNDILGQNVVRLGNIETGLDFSDNGFDTVTCLEVLEHLEDPQKALNELMRISQKRVIVTVPFDEKIQQVLCVHCVRHTPLSGHLHSFNKESFVGIVPNNSRLVKTELLCNFTPQYFPGFRNIFKLPLLISMPVDKLFNLLVPKANWIMLILDKTN